MDQSAAVPEFMEMDFPPEGEALPAAAAWASAVLPGCFPASTLPRNMAPSSIASRSVCTSPVTCPVLQSCTLSRPETFPSTFPRTITSRAVTSALTYPFGPMVRLPFVRLSFPSTWPSTKRSSLPVTSPFILIPWLMHAAALEETGTAFGVSRMGDEFELGMLGAPAGTVEISGTPCGFPSSFFHILTPRHRKLDFRSRRSSAGRNRDSEA